MNTAEKRAINWMGHRFFSMGPLMDFVAQALVALDRFESGLQGREKEAIARAKEQREENPPPPEEWVAPEAEEQFLRWQHRVVLPLNARYTALVSAVAGMEWLVTLLYRECMREATKFTQERADNANPENAFALKSLGVIIQNVRPEWRRVPETLKNLAQKGGIWGKESSQPLWEDFRALCIVRNAILHCGGVVKDVRNPKEFRDAAERLKFCIRSEMEVDGKKESMPLSRSSQLWIERDALKEPVERARDFIVEVHKAYFG